MNRKQILIAIVVMIAASFGRYYSEQVRFERRKAEMINKIREYAADIQRDSYSQFIITKEEK